jgi:threonine aldolase
MKMQRSLVLFAMVAALFAVTSTAASQQASAVHHIVHHKVIVVDPQAHGEPVTAASLKKMVKGPYGESDVIGGMMSGGY